MVAKIHFNVHIEDKTKITANEGEISMSMRVIPHVGKPKLTGTQSFRDAILQQFGVHRYNKGRKYETKVQL